MAQCITEAHVLQHSPSVGGNDEQVGWSVGLQTNIPSTDILYHVPSCTNHDLAIDGLATDYPIPNHQVIERWIVIVLVFAYLSTVAELAVLPIAVPFVECEQLEQLVD